MIHLPPCTASATVLRVACPSCRGFARECTTCDGVGTVPPALLTVRQS